jgi:quaternary ammonium compound-resistance protein SugE
MAWVYLLIAGLFEIGWAMSLKQTAGFTRLGPSVVTVFGMVASFAMLGLALRTLPLGTAYAVWTGIGTVGTVILGIVVLHESVDPLKLSCIALIVCGVIGLRFLAPH